MRRMHPRMASRTLVATYATLALLVAGFPETSLAQNRLLVTAEGGMDRPIGRDARRARAGPAAGITLESGTAGGAFMATFSYSSMQSRAYRNAVDQGDLGIWAATLGASRRTSARRRLGALATIAAGVAIVEEGPRSFGFVDIPPRTDWQPLLSVGLGAEYRRAALRYRIRSEVWVQPLTYSRDAYGARAAIRTTLGIGFAR
jgi:hypothetical protein